MKSVKITFKGEWYVCVPESDPVGPVTTEQIVRGVLAEKVPRDAFVARYGDDGWHDLLDVPEIVDALRSS